MWKKKKKVIERNITEKISTHPINPFLLVAP